MNCIFCFSIVLLVSFQITTATTIHVPDDQPAIQSALNVAVEGDTVLAAAGTYYENIIWPAVNGIKLIGSGEEDCIIDGDELGSVIRFEEELGGIIDSTTLVTGFAIQDGFAQHGSGINLETASPTLTNLIITDNLAVGYGAFGGGISCFNSNPTLTNVIITDNSAVGEVTGGGGIACVSSSPALTNVMITDNTVSGLAGVGGGIYCYNSSCPTLSNVTISGNAGIQGGGIGCWEFSNPLLAHVTITGNEAYFGGGLYCRDSNPVLDGALISYNHALATGGGMCCEYDSCPTLTNVTISENMADDGGGGIDSDDSNPVLENCILWEDTPQEIIGEVTVSCSDVQGGWEGANNIDLDPLFCDPDNGDYRLQLDSPCRTDVCGFMGYTDEFCVGMDITDLQITITVHGDLELYWSPVPESSSYNIYSSDAPAGPWSLESTVTQPFYTMPYQGGNGFFYVAWED
jgi:hypothetical protein